MKACREAAPRASTAQARHRISGQLHRLSPRSDAHDVLSTDTEKTCLLLVAGLESKARKGVE